MEQKDKENSNIVSLFGDKQPEGSEKESSFEEVMRKNAEIQERLKKERLKANQSVLRSYRIKS